MDFATQPFFLSLLLAAGFGVLSFLSPCVLPIVPPYLAYMSGVSINEMKTGAARNKILITAVYFVLGLSTVFLLLALVANRLAGVFLANQDVLNLIAGSVIILFGLHFIGLFRIGFLQRELRLDTGAVAHTPFGAYLLGLAFAFGWSPCLGPALGAILGLVANEDSLGQGLILMAVYAAGLGLPFIIAAIFVTRFVAISGRLRAMMPTIEKAMGGLLVFVGVLMISGAFSAFSFYLLEIFPFMKNIG